MFHMGPGIRTLVSKNSNMPWPSQKQSANTTVICLTKLACPRFATYGTALARKEG